MVLSLGVCFVVCLGNWNVAFSSLMVLLLPVVQECSAACYESLCMQMEAPCLADSLRGSYSVSCNT